MWDGEIGKVLVGFNEPIYSGGSSRGGGSGSNNHNQDSLSPSSPSPSIDSSSSDNIPQDNAPVLTQKSLKTGKSTLSNSALDEVPLLAGERIEAVYKDLTYLSAYANQGALKGTLTVTNYKLYFRSVQKLVLKYASLHTTNRLIAS